MEYRSTDLFIGHDISGSPSPSGAINTSWLHASTREQDEIKPVFHSSAGSFELQNLNDSPEQSLPRLPAEARYQLHTHIPRALLNTLGPPVVLAIYALVVYFYIVNNNASGIVPFHPLNARVAFYSWLVLSAFVLTWARAGIAGYEAAALGRPSMAPANAARFMWHADRIWAEFTGWCKALVVCYRYVNGKVRRDANIQWDGPSLLWLYLAISSIILHIAVPLAGLSMEFSSAFRLSDRPVVILGANETTFNSRPPDDIAEQAAARWRLGNPTTPEGAGIIYAPDGTQNVGTTYFEDAVQKSYQENLNSPSSPLNETISFFTGPAVSERAYGRVWGFLNHLACTPVNPYNFDMEHGLRILNVTGISDWETNGGLVTARNWRPGVDGQEVAISNSTMLGVTYHYIMAKNSPQYSFDDTYSNATVFPLRGRVELVMWQAYDKSSGDMPDETYAKMKSHPLVESSFNPVNNLNYLGYAVSCAAQTSVGLATISAISNTYSDFSPLAAGRQFGHGDLHRLVLSPGTPQIQTLVYTAFTTFTPQLISPPKCDVSVYPGCDGWDGANRATGGIPVLLSQLVNSSSSSDSTGQNITFTKQVIQSPSISPERMTLALQKLFGEIAISAMSSSPGNWTSAPLSDTSEPTGTGTGTDTGARYVYGLEQVPNIVPGIVHYMYPLVLLAIWVLITVLPQIHPKMFWARRWGPFLDGITMFRLGAQWTGVVHQLHTGDLLHLGGTALREVPGMIGDMNSEEEEDKGTGTMARRSSGYEVKGLGGTRGDDDVKTRMMMTDGSGGGTDMDAIASEFGFIGLSRRPARSDKGRYYTLRR